MFPCHTVRAGVIVAPVVVVTGGTVVVVGGGVVVVGTVTVVVGGDSVVVVVGMVVGGAMVVVDVEVESVGVVESDDGEPPHAAAIRARAISQVERDPLITVDDALPRPISTGAIDRI
ncbi:MAG TPA: hypothetical protein VMP13_01975 [Acidimicrobiia bacterium]|nr:hypothetical protein [Acidimicrobiia bacterium]